LREPSEKYLADFIRGSAAVLAGCLEEGISSLRILANSNDEVALTSRQRHLPWYYLGIGYEKKGERANAVDAYRRVLDIVPNQRPSLVRLSALIPEFAVRLGEFEPEIPCNVNFGGKVILLGFTLGREIIPSSLDGASIEQQSFFITCYWQFIERTFRDYHPAIHFCDEGRRILFQADHGIRLGQAAYPMDFPRCGEVVIEKQRLNQDPTAARYLRVGILADSPPKSLPAFLSSDGGSRYFSTVLSKPAAGMPAAKPGGSTE
jgi:hypothetical protein